MLAALALAYAPGLHGPFQFDDFGNLDRLGDYGDPRRWPALAYYLTSGTADPLGRPLAMLTFLLDGHAWPTDPLPFKRTNLLLHLLNTALLARVIQVLQSARANDASSHSPFVPWLAAGLWGAHPFFVSTTLYVVQREAMLPATFCLLAVLAWSRAVAAAHAGRQARAWAWALAGVGGATGLGVLCKLNAALIPLLVGLAHLWWWRPPLPPQTRARLRLPALCVLALPAALVVGYLAYVGITLWSQPLAARDWTLPQRLLSEPRALWHYAWRLALPRAGAGGLFVEGFAPSRGWLQPASTLPAMLALATSVLACVAGRRRWPVATFAWLFFLCGHLMESTTIPLELYFEHRNYLPAMFLGWPVAAFLLQPGAYRRYGVAAATLLLAGLLLLTWQRATRWGDAALMDALSGNTIGSARAQVAAAMGEVERGETAAGLARIDAAFASAPDSVDLALNAVALHCQARGRLDAALLARAQAALQRARSWNYGLYDWLRDAGRTPGLRRCAGFGLDGINALVAAAERNPQNASLHRKRSLWHVRGQWALAAGQPQLALRWFDAALLAEPEPDYALVQAAALGDAGAQRLGVAHLDRYVQLHARDAQRPIRDMAGVHQWLLRRSGYYGREIARLRAQLLADAAQSAAAGTPR